jgi:excisionase family DNA binding protein
MYAFILLSARGNRVRRSGSGCRSPAAKNLWRRGSGLPEGPDGKQKITLMGKQPHLSCLPKLVGAAVFAESIGCSCKHVYDLAQKGRIPHYRIGDLIRFDPHEIAEWLESHKLAA